MLKVYSYIIAISHQSYALLTANISQRKGRVFREDAAFDFYRGFDAFGGYNPWRK